MSEIDEIKEAIAGITAELKGTMDNFDRAWLVAERADLRVHLRWLEEAERSEADTATAETSDSSLTPKEAKE